MKRIFFVFLILFLFSLYFVFGEAGSFDGYSAILTNADRNEPFYFILDPEGLYGANPYTPWFYGRVLSFFKGQYENLDSKFRVIEPGEAIKINNLLRGMHIIVGFFYNSVGNLYPIKVVSIEAWGDGKEIKRYVVNREPVIIAVAKGSGLLKRFRPEPPKWRGVSSLVSFSYGFKPLFYFTGSFDRNARVGGNPEKKMIAYAHYWAHGGTGLRLVKVYIDSSGKRINFYINSRNNFKENTSIFLYIYKRGSKKINDYTIEIKPLFHMRSGGVLLWERGKGKPLYLGDLKIDGNNLEGSIAISKLPWDDSENIYFELSSCYFDYTSSIYEEFPLTTIDAKNIEVKR